MIHNYSEIKSKMRKYGITSKRICELVPYVSYSSLNQYLNGFQKMPERVKTKIEKILNDAEQREK